MNEGFGKAAKVLISRLCDAGDRMTNENLKYISEWVTVKAMYVFAEEVEREGLW